MSSLAVQIAVAVALLTAAHPTLDSPRTSLLPRTVWDSVYSAEQAARGQAAYLQACARCHQPELGGADESPALAGGAFLGNWNGQTLGDLLERIRTTMPPDDPGTFGRPLIADVLAYMLKVNGFPAGAVELPPDTERLKEIVLVSARPAILSQLSLAVPRGSCRCSPLRRLLLRELPLRGDGAESRLRGL